MVRTPFGGLGVKCKQLVSGRGKKHLRCVHDCTRNNIDHISIINGSRDILFVLSLH